MPRKSLDEISSIINGRIGGGSNIPSPTLNQTGSRKSLDEISSIINGRIGGGKAAPSKVASSKSPRQAAEDIKSKFAFRKSKTEPSPKEPVGPVGQGPRKSALEESTIDRLKKEHAVISSLSTAYHPKTREQIEAYKEIGRINKDVLEASDNVEHFFSSMRSITTSLRDFRKDAPQQKENTPVVGVPFQPSGSTVNAAVRFVGGVADNIIQTFQRAGGAIKEASTKETEREQFFSLAPSAFENAINLTGGFLMLQAMSAMPEIGGLAGATVGGEKGRKAGEHGAEAVEQNVFGSIQAAGGSIAAGSYGLVNPNATPEELDSIKEMAGLGAIILAFHGAGKAVGKGRSVIQERMTIKDTLKTAGDMLGVKDPQKATVSEIKEKYRQKVKDYEVIDDMASRSKIEALSVSERLLSSYAQIKDNSALRPQWAATWGDKMSRAVQLADQAQSFGEAVQEVGKIEAVLETPVSSRTKRMAAELEDPVTQYAFEREIIEAIQKDDPKSEIKTRHVDDVYDDRPAYFDSATGEIVFNDPVIAQDVSKLLNGDTIVVGGKRKRTFTAKTGERPSDLMKRYKETIMVHEEAHVKTITPDDLNRIREAEKAQNQSELDAIRRDLEDRAERYIFENTPKPKTIKRAATEELQQRAEDMADRVIARRETEQRYKETRERLKTERENLKFEERREEQYKDWKRRVSRTPELEEMDVAGLSSRLRGDMKERERVMRGRTATGAEILRRQRAERAIENLPDSDKVLDAFRERLNKERMIRQELSRAKSENEALPRETKAERKARETVEQEIKRRQEKRETAVDRQKNLRKADRKRMEEKQKTSLSRRKVKETLERAFLKQSAERAKARLRQKFNNKAAAQQILVDFMRENRVPKEVRGSFLVKLKNVKDAERAAEIIDDVRAKWNTFERKRLQKKIKKTLQNAKVALRAGLPRGKLTAEHQARIDAVREYVSMDRAEVNRRMVELTRKADEMQRASGEASYEMPEEIARQIDLLNLGGMKDQTLPQLRYTLETIQSYVTEGKTKRNEMIDARRARQNEVTKEIVEEVYNSPTRPLETRIDPAKAASNWREKLRGYLNNHSAYQAIARRVGGRFEQLVDRVSRKGIDALIEYTDYMERFQKTGTELYGSEKKWIHAQIDMEPVHDLGVFKNTKGEDIAVRVSRNNALAMWMYDQTKVGSERITRGNTWTPEIREAVYDLLKPEDKQMGTWLIDNGYAPLWDKLAPVFEERSGVPLGYRERYAGPMHDEGMHIDDRGVAGFAESGLNDLKQYSVSIDPGMVRRTDPRVFSALKLVDPFQEYRRYVQRATWYEQTAKDLTDLNAIIRDKDFRGAMETKYGKAFLETVDWHTENLTGGGRVKSGKDQWNPTGVDQLSNALFKGILSNVRVAVGQFSANAQYRAESGSMNIPLRDYEWGLRNRWNKSRRQILEKHVNVLRLRRLRPVSEISERPSKHWTVRKIKSTADLGMRLTTEPADQYVNMRGASGIFWGLVRKYGREGMSEKDAYVRAGEVVNSVILRTQPDMTFIGKPRFSQEAGTKFFAELTQQNMKIASSMIDAVRLMRDGRLTKTQATKYIGYTVFLQGLLFYWLRAGASVPGKMVKAAVTEAMGEKEKAEETRKRATSVFKLHEAAMGSAIAMTEQATGFFLIGDFINTILQNVLMGKNYEFRPGVTLNVFSEGIQRAAQQFASGDFDEGTFYLLRTATRALGVSDMMLTPFEGMKDAWAAKNEKRKRRKR